MSANPRGSIFRVQNFEFQYILGDEDFLDIFGVITKLDYI